MTTFTDNEGRKWTLNVNIAAVKRVRSLTDVDLLTVIGGDLLERLADDPILLCDVIYALCQPEAQTRNVSDEDFGRAMAGDAIGQATEAMLEALADFFPSPRANLLRQATSKLGELQTKVINHAERKITGGALDAQIERLLQESDESLMSVPASSESIPGP